MLGFAVSVASTDCAVGFLSSLGSVAAEFVFGLFLLPCFSEIHLDPFLAGVGFEVLRSISIISTRVFKVLLGAFVILRLDLLTASGVFVARRFDPFSVLEAVGVMG